MLVVIYYLLITLLFSVGVALSIRDAKHLESTVNGKFAKSVQPPEDKHDS